MDNYKQAAMMGLTYSTPKGELSTEQLFKLSMTDLATSIRAVKKIMKKTDDDDLAFLTSDTKVDKVNELRFEIMKDVYTTRAEAAAELLKKKEDKEYNEKIMAKIAKKEESELDNMSKEELMSLLKK